VRESRYNSSDFYEKGHSYGVKVHARRVSIDMKLLRSKFDAPAALSRDEVSATRE
jgi:hypothetical protein